MPRSPVRNAGVRKPRQGLFDRQIAAEELQNKIRINSAHKFLMRVIDHFFSVMNLNYLCSEISLEQ
jgi:hypothetical protein